MVNDFFIYNSRVLTVPYFPCYNRHRLITDKGLNYNFAYNTESLLLLLDEYTGHKTQEVQAAAKNICVNIMTIPLGFFNC